MLKFNIAQAFKVKQNEERLKVKREESMFIKTHSKRQKFSKEDFEEQKVEKRAAKELDKHLPSFEELHEKML